MLGNASGGSDGALVLTEVVGVTEARSLVSLAVDAGVVRFAAIDSSNNSSYEVSSGVNVVVGTTGLAVDSVIIVVGAAVAGVATVVVAAVADTVVMLEAVALLAVSTAGASFSR